MTTDRTVQTIELLGFAPVARCAAGMSDACAANNWNTTKYAWEVVSYSQTEAYDYWMSVREEHGIEFACGEISEALASVGKTVRDVARVMS